MSECAKKWQNVTKLCQNEPKRVKIVSKWDKMCQNVSKLCQNLQKCVKNILKWAKMCQKLNVSKILKNVSKKVIKRYQKIIKSRKSAKTY